MSSENIVEFLHANQLTVATAESCTAGLVASTLADVSGCGPALEGGYIVYSETAKQHYLGVSPTTMEQFGLTSEPVVREMVSGLAERCTANFLIALTGTAESNDELNGVVCFGFGLKVSNALYVHSETQKFEGDRNAVRASAANYALENIPVVYKHLLDKSDRDISK